MTADLRSNACGITAWAGAAHGRDRGRVRAPRARRARRRRAVPLARARRVPSDTAPDAHRPRGRLGPPGASPSRDRGFAMTPPRRGSRGPPPFRETRPRTTAAVSRWTTVAVRALCVLGARGTRGERGSRPTREIPPIVGRRGRSQGWGGVRAALPLAEPGRRRWWCSTVNADARRVPAEARRWWRPNGRLTRARCCRFRRRRTSCASRHCLRARRGRSASPRAARRRSHGTHARALAPALQGGGYLFEWRRSILTRNTSSRQALAGTLAAA